MHIRGRERETLGCILPHRRFVETVAALRGVDPDRYAMHDLALELAPAASDRVRNGLAALIARGLCAERTRTSCCATLDLANELFELMVDVYLHARPEPMRKSGCAQDPARIVRKAEERFAEAGMSPLSLADLCAAAGVGKTALYQAFHRFCGEAPIAYSQKRRLTRSRSLLLRSESSRRAVKQAPIGCGLTELGRFSQGNYSPQPPP
jgi:AraC-like DNA-binding protein